MEHSQMPKNVWVPSGYCHLVPKNDLSRPNVFWKARIDSLSFLSPKHSLSSFSLSKIRTVGSCYGRLRLPSGYHVGNTHLALQIFSKMPDQTLRPLGNFKPSLWGNQFSSFTLDTQLFETYSKEVEALKEEVKDILVVNDAGGGKSASEKMVLIDALERLGVSYLFEKEIEENLEDMFKNFEDNSHVFHDDLFMVSLHFRVFRQHGYNLSSSVFKKFTNGNGVFKETISNDMMGMLSFYEATYLKVHGEDILDEAFRFTKAGLESLKPHLSPCLGEHVAHALYQPLHRDIPRLQARYYISFYENDPSRNEKLLRLAKIDFNRLQMLHKQELCDLIRWWNDLDLRTHIPYARDRIVECFFSGLSTYFEPQYAFPRSIHNKSMLIMSALDDTYDAYGTYEELKLFTNAVERWDDMDAIDRLPTYMKEIYAAVQKFFGELHEEMSKQERTYGVCYLEEALKEIVRSYDIDTECLNKGHVPLFDEYLSNATVSVTAPFIVTSAFIGMEGEIATPEAFQWLQSKPRMFTGFSIMSRLINDIRSTEREKKEGHVATGIECYMKQHGVPESEAITKLYERIENAWKDMNEGMIRPTVVSKDLLMRVLNLARLHDVGYKNGNGYTNPEFIKDFILALIGDPIPI